MIAPRVTVLLAAFPALLALSGCEIDFHPPRPGDTACLGTQVRDFRVPFYRAVDICGTPNPDLTGDLELQQYASAYDISYRIQPMLDAAIKRHDPQMELLVGTHIPMDYGLTSAELSPQ